MVVTMKELLEAGVHFGHQVKRWNPKMKKYIFGQRNGIYIIDLQKTVKMFEVAYNFIRDLSSRGESILFVGTKKQAQDVITEESQRSESFVRSSPPHQNELVSRTPNAATLRRQQQS